MLGTGSTASDYGRPKETLKMAINGNGAEWAAARAIVQAEAASIKKKHAFT